MPLGRHARIGDGRVVEIEREILGQDAVVATVLEQTRGDKIIVFKKRRRKHYRRRTGHRQYHTVVRVTDIVAGA